MVPEKQSRFARSEIARAVVGLAGIIAAAWFFFTTEDPLLANLWLVTFLVAGEIGGRTAAKWVERHERTKNERCDR